MELISAIFWVVPRVHKNDAYLFVVECRDHNAKTNKLHLLIFLFCMLTILLVELGLCIILQFVGLGWQLNEMVIVSEVDAMIIEEEEQISVEMDQFLLCEMDLELSLGITFYIETTLVVLALVGTQSIVCRIAKTAHLMQMLSLLSNQIQCYSPRIIEIEQMIKKQSKATGKKREENEKVVVLGQLQTVLKKKIERIQALGRKVEEKRQLEQAHPQLASGTKWVTEREEKELAEKTALLREKERAYDEMKKQIVQRSQTSKLVQKEIEQLKEQISSQEGQINAILKGKEQSKINQEQLLQQIRAVNTNIKQMNQQKIDHHLVLDPNFEESVTLKSSKIPLLAEIKKMEEVNRTLIAACQEFIQ